MISSGSPHVLRAHTGVQRTCGDPGDIGLTATGVELNGSWHVHAPTGAAKLVADLEEEPVDYVDGGLVRHLYQAHVQMRPHLQGRVAIGGDTLVLIHPFRVGGEG